MDGWWPAVAEEPWKAAKLYLGWGLVKIGMLLRGKREGISAQGFKSAEGRQPTPGPNTNDSFYFSGASKDGSVNIFVRLSFRSNRRTERWLGVLVDGKIYQHLSPELSKEELDALTDDETSAGAVRLTCSSPMGIWDVHFDGVCVDEIGKKHHIVLDATAKMLNPVFDFDQELNAWPLARSLATQPWSPFYFQELKRSHQTHYEQFSNITGSLSIDSKPMDLNVTGMRDHSFGERDWNYMNRWVTMFGNFRSGPYLAFHVTLVHHPLSPFIVVGYLYSEQHGYESICDSTPMTEWGEDSLPPKTYSFRMKTQKSDWIPVECETVKAEAPAFWFNSNNSVLYERFAKYSVGGHTADGISEFTYGKNYVTKLGLKP